MADLSTLNNVTKDGAHLYRFRGNVDIGSGIDDLYDATIIVESGNYRFVNGCTTTFTRCTFIEKSSMSAYGADNYNGSARCRFKGSTCAPVFVGTHFIVEDDNIFGRSDFDIGDNATPTFKRAFYGEPCLIQTFGNVAQFNHFASANIVIDGLVIDDNRNGGDFEFRIPPSNVNELIIKDNNQGSNDRHFVVLMNLWSNNSTYEVNKLSARNVACWQGNNTKTLKMIDPVGDIRKATDTGDSQSGIAEIWRTYKVRPLDVETNQYVQSQVTITQGTTLIDQQTTADYQKALFQDRQSAGSTAVNTNNSYRRSICLWAHESVVSNVVVQWDANNPDGVNDGSVIMKKDNAITSTFAQVSARNQCNSLAQVYEQIKHFEMTRSEKHLLGDVIADAQGDTIKLTTPLTLLTGTIANPVQVTTGTTVYTTATLATSQFKSIDATVNITSQADADKLKGLRVVGAGKLAVNMPANSTLELDNITFDSPLHIESTNALTVVNKNGSNASVGSANVKFLNLKTVRFYNVPDGSEIRIIKGMGRVGGIQNTTGGEWSYIYPYEGYTQKIKAVISHAGFEEAISLTLTLVNKNQDIDLSVILLDDISYKD